MFDLTIAAYPTTPLVLMVTEGQEAREVDGRKCFFPDMTDSVREMLDEYDIETITVYGPRTYAAHVASTLNKKFPDTIVSAEFAGE